MATLYRKYRPQNFKEVVGQNHIKTTIEHEITSGKIAHAYLFCGPRAVGKTTMARVLAKAVNCSNRKDGSHEPCNKCESCQEITIGKSIDIIEIDAASHTGVDNVRENIIASARISPVKSKYKVFIIDEVHMLSTSAFNALLKIVEEPPSAVIFILCTTEIHKVPTTIISRCQRFDFKKISISDIAKKLGYIAETEGVKVDKDILEAIARQSEGHMRDAESLLGQVVSIGGKEVTRDEAELVIPRSDLGEAMNLVDFLNKKDAASAIRLVNKLVDEGIDLKVFTADLIEILRKMMLAKVNPGLAEKIGLELGESLEIKANEIGKGAGLENYIDYIEEFMRAKNDLRNASIIQLPLELAVIGLCSGSAVKVSKGTAGSVGSAGKKTDSIIASPAKSSDEPREKTAEPEVPAVRSVADGQVSHGDILSKWGEVIARIKKDHHSLSFVFSVCEPRDMNGNRLCLAFKYKFHKERLSNANIRATVEKVLAQVYGADITIEAVVDEDIDVAENNTFGSFTAATPAPVRSAQSDTEREEKQESVAEVGENGGNSMLDDLLKTFGGKVVG